MVEAVGVTPRSSEGNQTRPDTMRVSCVYTWLLCLVVLLCSILVHQPHRFDGALFGAMYLEPRRALQPDAPECGMDSSHA